MPVGLPPVDQFAGSVSERVYLSVRTAILTLVLEPGERINKKSLAGQLGASLSAVSEAITRLSKEGIVAVYPQAGTFVAPISMEALLEDNFLRNALETAAVERVAEIATNEHIVELQRSLRLQEVLTREGDSRGFFRLDAAMHEFLLKATGFPKVFHLTQALCLQTERARQLIALTPGRMKEAFEEHRAIVEAIVAGDPSSARAAMRNHLANSMRDFKLLEKNQAELFKASP